MVRKDRYKNKWEIIPLTLICIASVSFVQLAHAIEAPKNCAAQIRERLVDLTRSTVFSEVSLLPSTHARQLVAHLATATDKSLVEFAGLSEQDALFLRTHLAAHPIRNKPLSEKLRLVLYDPAAWDQFLNKIFRASVYEDIWDLALQKSLISMPQSQRTRILSKISSQYGGLSKSRSQGRFPLPKAWRPGYMGPRRAADLLIRYLIRTDEIVAASVNRGETPVQALQHYFDTLKTTSFSNLPNGGYSAESVLSVARALRSQLKLSGTREPEILIGGSFPNGRIKLESGDIDVQIADPNFTNSVPEMEAVAKRAFTKKYPNAEVRLDFLKGHVNQWTLAFLNPILVRVRSNSIEMLVFPPFNHLPNDLSFKNGNYPKPSIYRLE